MHECVLTTYYTLYRRRKTNVPSGTIKTHTGKTIYAAKHIRTWPKASIGHPCLRVSEHFISPRSNILYVNVRTRALLCREGILANLCRVSRHPWANVNMKRKCCSTPRRWKTGEKISYISFIGVFPEGEGRQPRERSFLKVCVEVLSIDRNFSVIDRTMDRSIPLRHPFIYLARRSTSSH